METRGTVPAPRGFRTSTGLKIGGDGHSVVAAYEQAHAVAGTVAEIVAVPLFYNDHVKLIGRDLTNEVVFYTECTASDAGRLMAILGFDETNEVTARAEELAASAGCDVLDAARLIRALDADVARRRDLGVARGGDAGSDQ